MEIDPTIQDLIDELAGVWNLRDGPAFGRLFAEDADYVTGAGIRLAGRHRILGVLTGQAGPSGTNQEVSLAAESVKLLPAGIAVVLCSWRMSAEARSGLLTMVIRRDMEGWRILALHNTHREE
jgi:uncharacterized protein (TIGR02246 family)